LKAAKLGNFLFGFTYGAGGRQGVSDRLAGDLLGELWTGAVSRVVGLSATAAAFSAASADGRNGAGLKIPKLREFLQETATAVEQFR